MWDQKCLIEVFLGYDFEKLIFEIFEISTFEFGKIQNFLKKQKFMTLRPKLHYFKLKSEKYIALFEIITLELAKMQNHWTKKETLTLEPKMDYLGVIWVILKNCCHI